MGEIMFVALVSDKHDEMALKSVADWTLRRRLLAVAGVAEVIPIGGETRQYQVIADPERLSAYGISLGDLSIAVGAASQNASAGFVTANGQEFLIQGLGRVRTLADIDSAVIVTRGDVPVLVRDVAEVRIGPAPRRGTGSYRASSAVVLGIPETARCKHAGPDQAPRRDDQRAASDIARRHAHRNRRIPAGGFYRHRDQ